MIEMKYRQDLMDEEEERLTPGATLSKEALMSAYKAAGYTKIVDCDVKADAAWLWEIDVEDAKNFGCFICWKKSSVAHWLVA